MTAPAAYLAGRSGWPGYGLAALVCLLLAWGVTALGHMPGKWLACLQFLWLALTVGELAKWLTPCWPTAEGSPLLSLSLLTLAAVAVSQGAAKTSRAGSILFWFLAGLFALVLGAGAKDLRGEYLAPSWDLPPMEIVAIFLLPAAAVFLPREKSAGSPLALAAIGAFGFACGVWTLGILSAGVARQEVLPFYTFSKSLSLFGVAERFEALVSAGLTMGFFALYSFLLAAAGYLAECVRPGWGGGGTILCGALAAFWFLLSLALPEGVLSIGTLLLLVLAPLVPWRKNLKKTEKSA